MDKNFRYKLTVILISFTLLLSLIIVVADYLKLKENVQENLETQIQMAEDEIITSLSTIDKVYNVLDVERAVIMEEYSQNLVELYKQNPDFSTWDYDRMKNESGMDIFIINSENKVIESSYHADVGLDFNECCSNFGKLLTERRELGVFTHDALDIQQKSREFKKFSYMPTPDKQYIIELAFYLEDKLAFKEFNFRDTIHRLTSENEQIKSVKVYNSLGILLGETDSEKDLKISPSRLDTFKKAFREFEMKEMTVSENGQLLTYRYIPYKADYTPSISTHRVVEIAYFDVPFSSVLKSYRNQFIFQIIGITIVTILLSIVLAKMISRPIHLAFHDVLTGLKNRAAFEDTASQWLAKTRGSLQLMIIDLDNFKLVNDSLGHGEGDKLLIHAAKIIDRESGKDHLAARIGGDEFVVLFSRMSDEEVLERANSMLQAMRESFRYLQKKEIDLSISIGIAKAEPRDTIDSLFHKADLALYQSKKRGKDQYSLYDPLEL
ncbi:GGDEF domain-containing protein [Sporosarcina sp. GW1-11]|uniref:GGDEF domain-containing protein n=1 Tax=Sporosarcina sp. GW1-11 TaxID=2899126 RepID=UPI00294DC83B|nr:GGDEF domain-containing protein [Sporosarcina sp. GW1-11]MDV6378093.1 GGDEF domain-containing protein [Sporosarcina sp. GW1-11]